jgi:hypothetical protein
MKKHYGKIVLGMVLISLILSIIALLATKVQAANDYPATTLTIPNSNNLKNPYLILYNVTTGALISASDGSFGANWENAAFDKTHLTNPTQAAISGWVVYEIPALTKGVTYGFVLCSSSTPSNSDKIYISGLYDAKNGIPYTAIVPVMNGEVAIR